MVFFKKIRSIQDNPIIVFLDDFEEYFSDYGEPIIIDIENGILSYESLEECIKNKEKMNGKKFKGKKISITILGKTINNSSKKIN